MKVVERVGEQANMRKKETLLGWRGEFVGKRRKRAWQMAPLCIFWLV